MVMGGPSRWLSAAGVSLSSAAWAAGVWVTMPEIPGVEGTSCGCCGLSVVKGATSLSVVPDREEASCSSSWIAWPLRVFRASPSNSFSLKALTRSSSLCACEAWCYRGMRECRTCLSKFACRATSRVQSEQGGEGYGMRTESVKWLAMALNTAPSTGLPGKTAVQIKTYRLVARPAANPHPAHGSLQSNSRSVVQALMALACSIAQASYHACTERLG